MRILVDADDCSVVDKIDALLLQRHTAGNVCSAGGRRKCVSNRKPEQDTAFGTKLEELRIDAFSLKIANTEQ